MTSTRRAFLTSSEKVNIEPKALDRGRTPPQFKHSCLRAALQGRGASKAVYSGFKHPASHSGGARFRAPGDYCFDDPFLTRGEATAAIAITCFARANDETKG